MSSLGLRGLNYLKPFTRTLLLRPAQARTRSAPATEVRALSTLVQSGLVEDQLACGHFLFDLLELGKPFERRVEKVTFPSRNINQRHVSVDLNTDLIHDLAAVYAVEVDLMPVAVVPKGLIHALDATSQGTSLSIVSRDMDSALGAALLLALAARFDHSLQVPENIPQRLREFLRKFPRRATPGVNVVEFASKFAPTRLTGEEQVWWDRVCEYPEWCQWFARLVFNFLLTVRVDREILDARIIKYNLTDGRTDRRLLPAPLRDLTVRTAGPQKAVVIHLPDVGRARSEHLRIIPPKGLFISNGGIGRRAEMQVDTSRLLHSRIRHARSQLSLYFNGATPGELFVLVNLWPEPRAFVAPARILSWYLAAYLLLLTIVVFDVSYETLLRSSIGAVISLSLLIPTTAIGYISRPDEEEIRWDVLRRTRVRLLLAAALALGSLGMAIFAPLIVPVNEIGVTLAVATLYMCLHASAIDRVVRRIGMTYFRVSKLERFPAKGKRSRLEVEWDPVVYPESGE